MRTTVSISLDLAQRLFAFLHGSEHMESAERLVARRLAQEVWNAAGSASAPEMVPVTELEPEVQQLLNSDALEEKPRKSKKRKKFSAEVRARMAEAQKKRWAKINKKKLRKL